MCPQAHPQKWLSLNAHVCSLSIFLQLKHMQNVCALTSSTFAQVVVKVAPSLILATS